jgi:hypothetical protein
MNDNPTLAGLRASPLVKTVTFQKCGGCVYHQKPDSNGHGDCFGNPPSVHVLGMAQDVLGRPAIKCETFVPRVHIDRPACALFKRKDDFTTLGSS